MTCLSATRCPKCVQIGVSRVERLYITMGAYDWTGIVEAPGEEAMMKAPLTIAGIGMAKSQTMSAVHIAKALDIIKELHE